MINTLNNTCDQMRKHITLAKSDSAPMLEEASVLVVTKQESEIRQSVFNAFTKHFIVSDDDLDLLASFAVPLNDQFFVVLNRVKKIHDDCEPLLGSENERLGLELMEQTSRNLDAGFKKLYNWVQRALKGLDFEDPQISGSIRHALRVLSERPTLFQNCLEFLAEAREQTLSDAFQRALSGEGEALGSAIELSAHDLLRYMGDMLAWVHSTTVSEKESLEGLFIADAEAISQSMKSGRASEPWLQNYSLEGISNDESGNSNDTAFDGEKALKELVSRSLVTISATLRERIELAVHQHDDIVLLFKAQNLLTFYHDLFTKLVGSKSVLSDTVSHLENTAKEHLYQVLASDSDTSWLSDPIEGPIRHKANLATLSALFAVKPPAEMSISSLEHFYEYYVGHAKDHAQIIAAANTTTAAQGAYSDEQIAACISEILDSIRVLQGHREPGAVYRDIMKVNEHRSLLKALEDAYVNRVLTKMLVMSGVGELLDETTLSEPDFLLARLPDYAAKLDTFLSTGYANVVSKVKNLDKLLEKCATETRSIEEDARDAFLEGLGNVFEVLEGMGGEYREEYPRSMEEVKVLIG
jgi:Conserved oligomeric complex COG6